MSTPLSRWKRTKRRNTPEIVGNFFQQLGAKILRARLPQNGTLDLAIEKVLAGIEVKGGDNNNRLRIPTKQLVNHLGNNLNLFPEMLDTLLYCLFCYRNPKSREKGKERRSKLSMCKDEYAVFSMLAQHTDSLYVFDHRVILGIQELFGTKKKKLPCDPEAEVVQIGRQYLESFNEKGALQVFSSIGLNSAEWAIRERVSHVSVKIGLFNHVMKLCIVEVLPREFMTRLDSVIKTPAIGTPAKRILDLTAPALKPEPELVIT